MTRRLVTKPSKDMENLGRRGIRCPSFRLASRAATLLIMVTAFVAVLGVVSRTNGNPQGGSSGDPIGTLLAAPSHRWAQGVVGHGGHDPTTTRHKSFDGIERIDWENVRRIPVGSTGDGLEKPRDDIEPTYLVTGAALSIAPSLTGNLC